MLGVRQDVFIIFDAPSVVCYISHKQLITNLATYHDQKLEPILGQTIHTSNYITCLSLFITCLKLVTMVTLIPFKHLFNSSYTTQETLIKIFEIVIVTMATNMK